MTDVLKPDPSLKYFFQQKSRFSDMINATCFNGRPILSRDQLMSEDTDLSTVFETDVPFSLNAYRDVIMCASLEGIYIMIAIENQKSIDYHMPLRTFLYDAYSYKKQHQNYLDEKKSNEKAKLKLVPVHTVVLYSGEKPWSGPRSLLDMMEIPEAFQGLLNNWDINLIELKDVNPNKFHNSDNRELVEGLQTLYEWKDVERMRGKRLPRDIMIALAALVDQKKELLRIIEEEKEETIDMCEAIDNFRAKAVAEGVELGKEQGRITTLLMQLKGIVDNLSNETIECIKESTYEQLDRLTMGILKVKSEQDIIDILS